MDLQINDARSLNLTEDVLDGGSGAAGGLGLSPGSKLAPRGRESLCVCGALTGERCGHVALRL